MNLLTLFDSLWVYEGLSQRKGEHGHPAIQVFLSPQEPFFLDFTEGRIAYRAAIVNAMFPRQCSHAGIPIAVFNIDYETIESQQLKDKYLGNNAFHILDESSCEKLISLYHSNTWRDDPLQIPRALLSTKEHQGLDPRITQVLAHVRNDVEEQYSTAELAQIANLSESHFLHLFKLQMGIPVSKYMHWRRMRHAFALLGKGKSLSEISLLCGFADLSHFHRTFKGMFGLPPSRILKKRGLLTIVWVNRLQKTLLKTTNAHRDHFGVE